MMFEGFCKPSLTATIGLMRSSWINRGGLSAKVGVEHLIAVRINVKISRSLELHNTRIHRAAASSPTIRKIADADPMECVVMPDFVVARVGGRPDGSYQK